ASIAAGLSLLGVKTTYRDRIIALEQSRVQASETSA
ncbi:uncharacterized protein METZ01_LOCUS25464, partial [marine metagenome]